MRQMLMREAAQPLRVAAPASGPHVLLVRLRSATPPSGASQAEDGAWADGLMSEGWSVLELEGESDDDVAAAVGDALGQLDDTPSSAEGGPQLIVLADHGLACTAARALIALDQHRAATAACGLATIDAFAEPGFASVAEQLAQQAGVATLWAVSRGARDLRVVTFTHHAARQAGSKDSHFLVLPDSSRELAALAADPQSAFGREFRWLLAPVNSRG
ncbi:hypothetical protein [Rhodopseudomonas palustris]|uniref:Uncharacterized protein n=1 Tax=Rhodopseudomonas palustris TaxID=1076 RepID=A0A418V0K7_RHOPL|nr:hypothetical protein [Rhodopseudomonas palustris]RJF69372.1 hypothetical protein D4Q52_20530 [Rhodopseudomonas palustris]